MKKSTTEPTKTKLKPAMTPEGREQQCIALAYDLAEKRLRDGSATSQEVTHFLKLGTSMAKLEKEKLELDKELAKAKIKAYGSSEEMNGLYKEVLTALTSYKGDNDE